MNIIEEYLESYECDSNLLEKLNKIINPEYFEINGETWRSNSQSPVSKELEKMILLEIELLEKRMEDYDKNIDELKKKEKLANFFDGLRLVSDNGYLFEILFILSSTDKARLIEVEGLGEIWIPRTQCKIKGNLLFIRAWWVDEKKGYKGGQALHLKDWEKLIPEHYNTSIVNQRYESEEDNSEDPNYCGACMESPCMCSDPY